MVTKEFKGLVHGDYGKTPAPISAEFTKKILGDEKPITCRFADTLAPEMDKLKTEAAKWATQEEDVLTYAMFPQVAPKFFEKRNAKKQGVDADQPVSSCLIESLWPLAVLRGAFCVCGAAVPFV